MSYVDTTFDLRQNNVIVGPNNSGKTNLLRILRMMQSDDLIEYLKLPAESRHKNTTSQLSFHLELTDTESKNLEQMIFNDLLERQKPNPSFSKIQIVMTWLRQEADGEEVPDEVILRISNGITIVHRREGHSVFYTDKIILNYKPIEIPDPIADESHAQYESMHGFNPIKLFSVENYHLLSSACKIRSFFTVNGQDCSIRHDFSLDPSTNVHVLQSSVYDYVEKPKKRENILPIFLLIGEFMKKGLLITDEILPSIDKFTEQLFDMKSKKEEDYEAMKTSFSDIFPGVRLEVRDDGRAKRIFIHEHGKSFLLESSSSGYFKTLYVLYQMHDKKNRSMFFDELETHLHPNSIKSMAEYINLYATGQELSSDHIQNDNSNGKLHLENQITIITHSPTLVPHSLLSSGSRRLFYVRKKDDYSVVHTASENFRVDVKANLFDPKIFFDRCVVLVEGASDEYAMRGLSDRCGNILGKNGITLINMGGKDHIQHYLKLLAEYGIPCVAMADSDCNINGDDCVIKLPADLEEELKSYGCTIGTNGNREKVKTEEAYELMNQVADEQIMKEGALYRVLQKAEEIASA